MEKPILSIIVCSKNRHEEARRLIASIGHLKHGDIETEIVIVEESAEPSPIEGTLYHHIPLRNLGFGFARAKAVEVSHGSILIFIDDDCLPAESWLDNLTDPFGEEEVTAVQGGILPQSAGSVGNAITLLGFPAGGGPSSARMRRSSM